MNWYKKAKLIDRNISNKYPLSLSCMYCNRFATHPINEKADKQDYTWKTINEMNPKEKIECEKSIKESNISHGVCPRCLKILENFHKKNIHDYTAEIIRKMSLMKRLD